MHATATKLPTAERPLIRDRDIAAGVEKMLATLAPGKELEEGQDAVRRVATSGIIGTRDKLLAAYAEAIDRIRRKRKKGDSDG